MRGCIHPRGKNKWLLAYDIGPGPDGKRQQRYKTVHGIKKVAERELTRILHELATGSYIEPSKTTVAEYLDQWLETYAKTNVCGTTLERYTGIIEKHLKPALGTHVIGKLQPLHIQSYYAEAVKSGHLRKAGGLSARTVIQHHRVLRRALLQAVRWQIISRNPVDAVEPPRLEKKEMSVPTDESVQKLLEVSGCTKFYLPILLAASTGMRRGEILALKWGDVDLDEGLASIRRSLEQTRAGLRFKEPKSGKARVVVLSTMTVEALQQHRVDQELHKMLFGSDYHNDELICARPDGQPMVPDNFSREFRDIVTKAKIRHTRFHDLRHFHATALMGRNVHPKVVSERLGHSTVGITLDLYSHCLPSMQIEAARKIDEALRTAPTQHHQDT
jgi:integrase